MENEMNEFERGVMAPADGNAAAGGGQGKLSIEERSLTPGAKNAPFVRDDGSVFNASGDGEDMGPNFERLEEERPELVNALRELVRQYRMEGVAARRHEIRTIVLAGNAVCVVEPDGHELAHAE
jgi:hypothetical protein